MSDRRARLGVVVAGHVDHGKSTLVGRLLADSGSLPEGRVEAARALSARESRPFEYAHLLDALRDEQSQGITIDVARAFLRTPRRDYMILDAPGHAEFLKNMVTGAAHASAAVLVVDAVEGVRENSRRHGYLLAMLGLRRVIVAVNKMDAVGRREEAFSAVAGECREFLGRLKIVPAAFVPVSAALGENLVARAGAMAWHRGPTVLEALEALEDEPADERLPLRLPVQDVYKLDGPGGARRVIVGTVESGTLAAGDELVFYPSGKTARAGPLEDFPGPAPARAPAGRPAAFTPEEPIYIRRGEVAARRGEPAPEVARRLRASVFWLGREPLRRGRDYALKLGTARARARLESVAYALDAATLERSLGRDFVARHEAAECVLSLDAPLAFDPAADDPRLGRFVLVDTDQISGGGLAMEALPDESDSARRGAMRRNEKWVSGLVGRARREERLGQKACLVLVTGDDDQRRRAAAKALEARLFSEGRFAYFLGIGSVLYGLDADLREEDGGHDEDIRRLAEVAHLMLDAGLILIVTASRLAVRDQGLLLAALEPSRVLTAWIGGAPPAGLSCDAAPEGGGEECAARLADLLSRRGFLPGQA